MVIAVVGDQTVCIYCQQLTGYRAAYSIYSMYKRLTHIMHDWRQFVDQSQRCTGKEEEVGEEEEKGEGGGRGRGGEQQ